MHGRRVVFSVAAFLAALGGIPVTARNAFAFGGTADHLGQQGNFVISNRAGLGFDQGLSYAHTSFSLAPELDYFVIPNFSIGGAAILNWDSSGGTSGGVVPQIAYHVVLSDTWSFWPRLAVPLMSGSPARLSVEISAPFLLHPADHFFFGFGPAVSTDLTGDNKITHLFGTFLVGGYFNS